MSPLFTTRHGSVMSGNQHGQILEVGTAVQRRARATLPLTERKSCHSERKSCRSQGLISLSQSQNCKPEKNFERARLKIGSRCEATFHGYRNRSPLPKLQPPALTRSWSSPAQVALTCRLSPT